MISAKKEMAEKELGQIVALVKKQIPALEEERDINELERLRHSLVNEVMDRTSILRIQIMRPAFIPQTAEEIVASLAQESEIQKISQEVSVVTQNLLNVINSTARRSSAEYIRRLNEALKPIEDWLEKCRRNFGL